MQALRIISHLSLLLREHALVRMMMLAAVVIMEMMDRGDCDGGDGDGDGNGKDEGRGYDNDDANDGSGGIMMIMMIGCGGNVPHCHIIKESFTLIKVISIV